jgi:hypothetical protein
MVIRANGAAIIPSAPTDDGYDERRAPPANRVGPALPSAAGSTEWSRGDEARSPATGGAQGASAHPGQMFLFLSVPGHPDSRVLRSRYDSAL